MEVTAPYGYQEIVPLQKTHRVLMPTGTTPVFCRTLNALAVSLAEFTVAALAAVEGLLEPERPGAEHAVPRRRSPERTPLLDDERGDDREDAHAPILAARFTSIPAVAPQMVWPWCSIT